MRPCKPPSERRSALRNAADRYGVRWSPGSAFEVGSRTPLPCDRPRAPSAPWKHGPSPGCDSSTRGAIAIEDLIGTLLGIPRRGQNRVQTASTQKTDFITYGVPPLESATRAIWCAKSPGFNVLRRLIVCTLDLRYLH